MKEYSKPELKQIGGHKAFLVSPNPVTMREIREAVARLEVLYRLEKVCRELNAEKGGAA